MFVVGVDNELNKNGKQGRCGRWRLKWLRKLCSKPVSHAAPRHMRLGPRSKLHSLASNGISHVAICA